MKIVCLGWGSLIWKSSPLPVSGPWFADGPQLSIEFSRVGDGGELATAICINAPLSTVLWAVLDTECLDETLARLRERVQIPNEGQDGLGSLILNGEPTGPIALWARARMLDAVIWTALPPRYDGIESRVPNAHEAVQYLSGLTGEPGAHAKTYFEQMVIQISTPYRRAIAQALGW